jgi:hypothetical protein
MMMFLVGLNPVRTGLNASDRQSIAALLGFAFLVMSSAAPKALYSHCKWPVECWMPTLGRPVGLMTRASVPTSDRMSRLTS